MDASIVLLLAWMLPWLIGIGLKFLMERRTQKKLRDGRSCPETDAAHSRDDVPSYGGMSAIELPALLSADAWAALGQHRLRRFAALAPASTNGFDGSELIRRATCSTYVDSQQLGAMPGARDGGDRPSEVTST
jgi:hypothetical protein